MDSTYYYSEMLILQAHLRMYSLTHTDSFVQPIADKNRQSVKTAQATLFQGICNVQSGQDVLLLKYIHKISLYKVLYNQQSSNRAENNSEYSSA
jgi:hypothetical protein